MTDKENQEQEIEETDEAQPEEIEETTDTEQQDDNNEEQTDNEEAEDKDEQQEASDEDTDEQGDGLTKQEREYYTNEIEKLDNELFEIKEAKALETVKERMKATKYTPSQIERYAGYVDKNDIDKSITQLKSDISPAGHKYVDPSLNNAARQKVSGNPKDQLYNIGKRLAKSVQGRKGRRN